MTDNHAELLAELEQHVNRETLAIAVGVSEEQLSWIEASRAPEPETAERLLLLLDHARRGELHDPSEVLIALGEQTPSGIASLRILARTRYRWVLIAFFAIDAVAIASSSSFSFSDA